MLIVLEPAYVNEGRGSLKY